MRKTFTVVCFLLFLGSTSPCYAYEPETHREIAQRAAGAGTSLLDRVLKGELALPGGVDESFLGLTVPRLVGNGAFSEDSPPFRALNHFHNPLLGWDAAGLREGIPLGQSSVIWQQNQSQDPSAVGGGNWSWQDTRRRYLEALTGKTKGQRENGFVNTFLGLGHLSHLIQDASVPGHTRNDAHLFYEGYEAWVEAMRRGGVDRNGQDRRALFLSLLTQDAVFPALSIFTATGDTGAPVPIARLIDSDLFGGLNTDILSGTLQGMAEYANGNFLSDDTIFRDFALPRPEALGPAFAESEGQKQRRYFAKVSDGVGVRHFVAEGTFFERLLFRGRPERNDILTDRVYEDYAALLLPRAVGYSAALLNYFFRNKLDVDLFADPSDPALVQVKGTNASSDPNAAADPLVEGDLKLYWDDASGVRSPVAAVESTALSNVAGGGEITSARFQPPTEAERFIAVYQGTLGNEIKDPSRNFPGGVIGKVLGGYRVEQLFPDGTRWNLRTPKGIFPLPILQADVVDLRWGDLDNTLVGRSKFTSGTFGFEPGPNRMFAYRIKRPLGSVDVPVVNGMVDVEQVANILFPLGLDIGGVQLNAGISYRQYLVSFFVSTVVSGNNVISAKAGAVTAEVAVTGSASTALAWRLTLDEDKLGNFRGVRPHIWELKQIGLRADGHIVVLVLVTLNPEREFAHFPSRVYVTCGAPPCPTPPTVEDGPPVPVVYSLGRVARAVWALVDVTDGRLLHSTAPSTLTINNVVEVTGFNTFVPGGSSDFMMVNIIVERVDEETGAVSYGVVQQSALRCLPTQTSADVEIRSGVLSASQVHLRPELAAGDFSLMVPPRTVSVIGGCFGLGFGTVGVSAAARVTQDSGVPVLPYVQEAFRATDGPERVVVLLERQTVPGAPTFGNPQTRVIAWDPSPATARLVLAFPEAEVGSRQILGISHDLGLVRNPFPPLIPASMSVIPLEGTAQAQTFPISSLESRNFRVLSPAFLYHVSNLKFHRARDLARTVLPATLATGGNTFGDHHATRLP